MTTDREAAGLELRRTVLGREFVDDTLAAAAEDEFASGFQAAVNDQVWGATWARTELDLRTRCVATVSMLIALGRPRELRTHMRAAISNGVTADELYGIVLHALTYCGAPAAVEAMGVFREVATAA